MMNSLFLTVIFAAALGQASENSCLNPLVKLTDESTNKASHFLKFEDLPAKPRAILENFLNLNGKRDTFESWTTAHNDQAATYMATMNALGHVELDMGNNTSISAMDVVQSVSEIRGVRLITNLDQTLMKKWIAAGASYTLYREDGKSERGKVKFADHNQRGGALHCGFDIQGFTHFQDTPYLHWNYRESDGLADVHLDGFQPWFLGFIPNPKHLSYENSDVRVWFKNYLKKYGSPGFEVSKK